MNEFNENLLKDLKREARRIHNTMDMYTKEDKDMAGYLVAVTSYEKIIHLIYKVNDEIKFSAYDHKTTYIK